jgi:hypothetical protein
MTRSGNPLRRKEYPVIAPPPLNLAEMADAWNNPTAFAAQLATYYRQLERDGYRVPTPDRTTAGQ